MFFFSLVNLKAFSDVYDDRWSDYSRLEKEAELGYSDNFIQGQSALSLTVNAFLINLFYFTF